MENIDALPFFSSFLFFLFWYKMIQTTIQNSCAVDVYKRSRDAASPTARDAELRQERITLQNLAPHSHSHAGCRALCPFPKETCKKKSARRGRGRKSRMRSRNTDGHPARVSGVSHVAGCLRTRGCVVLSGVIPFSLDNRWDRPLPQLRTLERTVVLSRDRVLAGAPTRDTEASLGLTIGRYPDTLDVLKDMRKRPRQTGGPGCGGRRLRPGPSRHAALRCKTVPLTEQAPAGSSTSPWLCPAAQAGPPRPGGPPGQGHVSTSYGRDV